MWFFEDKEEIPVKKRERKNYEVTNKTRPFFEERMPSTNLFKCLAQTLDVLVKNL